MNPSILAPHLNGKAVVSLVDRVLLVLHGEPMPPPDEPRILQAFRLPASLCKRLEKEAARRRTSKTALAEAALVAYFGGEQPAPMISKLAEEVAEYLRANPAELSARVAADVDEAARKTAEGISGEAAKSDAGGGE